MLDLNFPNPVEKEDDFYGRRLELERAVNILAAGKIIPVVILGERRVGKTSLQNMVIARLDTHPQKAMMAVKVRSIDIHSLDDLVEAIFQRLASAIGSDVAHCGLLNAQGRVHLDVIEQFDVGFRNLLQAARRPFDGRYLICMDEFDEVLRNAGGEAQRIDSLVQHLTGERELPVSLLFTMTRLPEAERQSLTIPFISMAEVIALEPLSYADMCSLVEGVAGDVYHLEQAELQWLYGISGGNPYFTKLILWHLDQVATHAHEAPVALPVSRALIETALHLAVDDPRPAFVLGNVYTVHFNDYEKRIILLLALRQQAIEEKVLTGDCLQHEPKYEGTAYLNAARSLVQRAYLEKSASGYDFRIQYLGYWLREWIEFHEELERLDVYRMASLLGPPV